MHLLVRPLLPLLPRPISAHALLAFSLLARLPGTVIPPFLPAFLALLFPLSCPPSWHCYSPFLFGSSSRSHSLPAFLALLFPLSFRPVVLKQIFLSAWRISVNRGDTI
jgi:hypothetical protein